MKHITSCIALVFFVSCASAAHVTLHSGRSEYLGAKREHSPLTPDGLSGILAALLSTEPPSETIAAASAQVESVLSRNVFSRPSAVLALQVIGGDEALKQTSFKAKASHALDFSADASSLLQSVAAVASGKASAFLYKTLDHVGLPATCDERCQELHVQDMVHALGFNYTARKQPSLECSAGPWCSWVTAADDKLLDMGLLADRLWALELGILRANVLQAAAGQKGVAGEEGQQPKLLEATLVGLQAIKGKYGPGSVQAQAAQKMLHGVLAQIWQALSEAYKGKVVMQLASANLPAGSSPKLEDLMQWRASHRQIFQRRLLQQDANFVTSDFGALSVQWATSSVAWLISITILVFIIAASVCLCNMSFEQDTLLWARPKVD